MVLAAVVVLAAIVLERRYQLQPEQLIQSQLDRAGRALHHREQAQTAAIRHLAQSHQLVAVVVAAAQVQVKLAQTVVRAVVADTAAAQAAAAILLRLRHRKATMAEWVRFKHYHMVQAVVVERLLRVLMALQLQVAEMVELALHQLFPVPASLMLAAVVVELLQDILLAVVVLVVVVRAR